MVTPASATPMLRAGDRGPAVPQLQTRLDALRYDVGPLDGVFGPSTTHAVIAFQKVNGPAPDGVVGPATRAALANPRSPKVRRAAPGAALEVDLRRQVMVLVRDGRVRRIYDVSTGTARTPTPTGRYQVIRTIDGWRTSRLGRLWRPAYFSGGYAIHGSTSVPSRPASHGCVRVPIPSMNRLWPSVRIGMRVELHRGP